MGSPRYVLDLTANVLHDFQCNACLSVEMQDYVLIAPRVFVTDSDSIIEEGSRKGNAVESIRQRSGSD